jgi:signal peptidase II
MKKQCTSCRLTNYLLLFFTILGLDRLTKFWAISELQTKNIKVCSFLDLSLGLNRGMVFGLFSFQRPFYFYLITSFVILVLIFFLVYVYAEFKSGKSLIAHIMLLAGAVSNIIDRFIWGGVVDFVDFHVGSWHWYTFNIADVFIVVGIFYIAWREIFHGNNKLL